MAKQKIIVISTVSPGPVDSGKKVVISGLLHYLLARYGADQITYVLIGSGQTVRPGENLPFHVVSVRKPGALVQFWNVFWYVMLRRKKSLQEALLYSKQVRTALMDVLRSTGPDLVIYDTVRTGQYKEELDADVCGNARHILYMDDLFSLRYQRMINTLETYPGIILNPLGSFAAFIPSLIRPVAQLSAVQKLLLKSEARLIEKTERNSIRAFDRALLLNEQEVECLRGKTGATNIYPMKPLLQTTDRRQHHRRYIGDPVYIFLGALNYTQNQVAISHFIANHMPSLIRDIPGVKLRIIGRGADAALAALAAQYIDHITIEGYVDDLDSVFSSACAMLVPLLFGSGLKLKTLEALSRGLPIISTEIGVEGIPVKPFVHCFVENDLSRFVAHMVQLCDRKRNSAMSRSAQEFFAEQYSRQTVMADYDRLFQT